MGSIDSTDTAVTIHCPMGTKKQRSTRENKRTAGENTKRKIKDRS
jgi:hypothetical protein